jgi:D-alanyl-D-alanine carboxypeptidase
MKYQISAAPAALIQNPAMPTPKEIAKQLVLLEFEHWDFWGNTKPGSFVIYELLVQDVLACVRKAWEIEFPIHQAVSPAEFGWCDKASCAANNSSAHNMRYINGTTKLSKHAGSAFDLNPMQNPCFEYSDDGLKVIEVTPPRGSYDPRQPGTLYRAHPIVQLMLERGWDWGGNWTNPWDPQHFQKVLPETKHLYN